MPAKTRPQPSVEDPLAETTPQRRVWAAYLKAGYSRARFARALGVSYQTVDQWDTEQSSMSAKHLAKVADVLGISMDELWRGRVSGSETARPRDAGPPQDATLRKALVTVLRAELPSLVADAIRDVLRPARRRLERPRTP
jgi:transcriptional regulator with XRE-family HTH domain